MRTNSLTLLVMLSAGLPALRAASAGAPAIVLPPVDVVAAPIVGETRVNAFGFQTTTIGGEQIAALNAPDLAAALRRTPGASIARYNPVGAFGGGEGGAVFLRGLGSSRPGGELKTTLEGVPVGNGVFNHPMLDLLSMDLASGVEVSRRAEPLAAGNMFAGVNLTAPRVTGLGSFVRGTLSAGSFGTVGEKLEAGVRSAGGEIYAGQGYRRADGHRPDADGQLVHLLVRAAWRPVSQFELTYLVHRTENRATDPGAEPGSGVAPTRGDVYQTRAWTHVATAAWTRGAGAGAVKAYLGDGEADWLRRGTSGNADSLNEYRLSGIRWRESQRPWEGGEVVGGIDWDWSRGRTRSVPAGVAPALSFGPDKFRLFSAYAGVKHTMAIGEGIEFTPSAGMRHYRHDVFGAAWAPQVSTVLQSGPWQMHASFGRAMNFPGLEVAAFSTVAIPALGQSWRTLRPERLDQLEAGVRRAFPNGAAVELTVFRNRARNRFVFVPPPPPPFRFVNLESFRTQGAELTVSVRPAKRLSLFGGVSHLEVTPADLPYAPRWSLVGGATWRMTSALTLNLDAAYVSAQRTASQARAGGAINTERVSAHALINGRLAYEFAGGATERGGTEVFLAVENLLDRDYRYRPGYPMPGIGFTVGASTRF